MDKTEGTSCDSEDTKLSPFRFPDGTLKPIAGGADDDEEEEDEDDDVTDDDDEEATDDDDDNDEEDDEELAEAIAKAIEKAKAEWQESGQKELERIRRESERKAKARKDKEDNEKKLTDSFGDTVKEIRNKIRTFKVRTDDGGAQDVTLSDDFLQEAIFKPLNAYNTSSLEAAAIQIRQELGRAALEALPENVRDEFVENAEGKELDEWVKVHGETYAPHSEWAKAAEKQHKLALEAAVAAAEVKGFKRGQKAPAGSEPPSSKKNGRKPDKIDKTTLAGISKARANEEISEKEFMELWKKLTNKF